MKIDLGCGASKKAGFIGVDSLSITGVDITHDLNNVPYPFYDGQASEIWMDQVLEHLGDPLKTMEEIYRISAPNALVTIGVPYFRSVYSAIDPTHKNFFTSFWFHYFDEKKTFKQKYQYTKANFEILRIEFDREFKTKRSWFRFPLYRAVLFLAEKKPEFYEFKISHLFPLNSITFYLKAIKK